jgi:NADH-quinone oxidoreductase subunit N
MGGLPPLAGFFVKLYIYIEAISSGFFIFVFVSLVVTIISTFYYLFFLKSIFFDKSLWSKLISLEMSRSICIYIIVVVCLFLVGFMFIIPFIYTAIVAMSCSLYSPFWYIYLMLDVSFLIF